MDIQELSALEVFTETLKKAQRICGEHAIYAVRTYKGHRNIPAAWVAQVKEGLCPKCPKSS